jgi:hypothetical protein
MTTAVASVSRNGSQKASIGPCTLERITPPMAERYLQEKAANRPLSGTRVEQYASSMRNGEWRLTHQGIAFDEQGRLCDGQHRLAAIVRSGVAVRMYVFREMDHDDLLVIDIGRIRSASDAFTFVGVDADKAKVAAARMLYASYHYERNSNVWGFVQTLSHERLLQFFMAMEDAISFATFTPKVKLISHACTTAAIASAWFTQDRARLDQFKEHIKTGVVSDDSDNAAIRVRELLLGRSLGQGGASVRQELLMRICTALRAYVEHRPLSKLYKRADSLFSIPDVEGF